MQKNNDESNSSRITIEDGGQVVGDMSCMSPLQNTFENE